jgi:hypothetical protein
MAMVLMLASTPVLASAQDSLSRTAARWTEASAGSELERYLRALQLGGASPARGWSVRAFSPAELAAIAPEGAHPWAKRFGAAPSAGWWVVRPSAELIANTGIPWGINDGPTWAGKGITMVATGGVAARWRGVSAQLAPHMWWTQNADFTPLPPASQHAAAYLDYVGRGVDLPQRFGAKALGQMDLGESWLRIDGYGVTAGVSSASEWWGPGIGSGAILSNNAGGIPRIFLGTSSPRNVGIGRVHGRLFAGRLVRSSFSEDTANHTGKRLGLGLVGSFEPRGLPGLELGLTRFFHRRWRTGGPNLSDLRALWEPFLKEGITGKDDLNTIAGQADNQLASVFGRLVLPRSGLEVYAEYGREDHSWDGMDITTEPDHISLVTFGMQKRFGAAAAATYWIAHGEVTNGRVTHLDRIRGEGLFYEHGQLRDGHTLRGQLLGSPFVRGGSGADVGVDRYTASGRLSVRWRRIGLARSVEGGLGYGATHVIEASGVRFYPRGDMIWLAGLGRRVGDTSARDATNLSASIGWRWTP